jgi:hypothetical protein
MIVQITPIALESIKYKYYIVSSETQQTPSPKQMLIAFGTFQIFAIINASFVPIIYLFFPGKP